MDVQKKSPKVFAPWLPAHKEAARSDCVLILGYQGHGRNNWKLEGCRGNGEIWHWKIWEQIFPKVKRRCHGLNMQKAGTAFPPEAINLFAASCQSDQEPAPSLGKGWKLHERIHQDTEELVQKRPMGGSCEIWFQRRKWIWEAALADSLQSGGCWKRGRPPTWHHLWFFWYIFKGERGQCSLGTMTTNPLL